MLRLLRSVLVRRLVFLFGSLLLRCVALVELLSVPERCGTVKVRLEGTLHVRKLALHTGIPVVLDRVVGAALKHLCDLGPLVVDDAVHQEQDPLFLFVPVDLLDAGVEVVVPALAALLAHAAVQVL